MLEENNLTNLKSGLKCEFKSVKVSLKLSK